MKLRTLPLSLPLGCYRALVRVDWNVPKNGDWGTEASLRFTRSFPLLTRLRDAGAITFILTHLGRPKGREAAYSTKPLAKMVSELSGLTIQYLDADLSSLEGREKFAKDVDQFQPGDLVLLENVRFQKGEEKNDAKLVAAYAEHADLFINDAFASSHRGHASVLGLAKAMPSFAGPSLEAEVEALSALTGKPHKPFLAIIGGSKLSTKLPVLQALLKTANPVCIGGAMAHAFFTAKKMQIGKSYVEHEGISAAKKLMKRKNLHLPVDVLVASKVAVGVSPHAVSVKKVGKNDIIVDIGPETMRLWSDEVRKAKTIMWNGPVGIAEIPAFSHGSLVVGRAIAARAKGKAYGVAGGGDTLPVVTRTGMQEWFDFVSTGGGAMLDFVTANGKLPGLAPLYGSQKLKLPPLPHEGHKEKGMSCAPENIIVGRKKSKKRKSLIVR